MYEIDKGVRQLVADAASQIAGNYCRAANTFVRDQTRLEDYPSIQPQCKPLTEQLHLFAKELR